MFDTVTVQIVWYSDGELWLLIPLSLPPSPIVDTIPYLVVVVDTLRLEVECGCSKGQKDGGKG